MKENENSVVIEPTMPMQEPSAPSEYEFTDLPIPSAPLLEPFHDLLNLCTQEIEKETNGLASHLLNEFEKNGKVSLIKSGQKKNMGLSEVMNFIQNLPSHGTNNLFFVSDEFRFENKLNDTSLAKIAAIKTCIEVLKDSKTIEEESKLKEMQSILSYYAPLFNSKEERIFLDKMGVPPITIELNQLNTLKTLCEKEIESITLSIKTKQTDFNPFFDNKTQALFNRKNVIQQIKTKIQGCFSEPNAEKIAQTIYGIQSLLKFNEVLFDDYSGKNFIEHVLTNILRFFKLTPAEVPSNFVPDTKEIIKNIHEQLNIL